MEEEQENLLHFKGNNPGATLYGNFINYYNFHPPENRISLLPKDCLSHLSNIQNVHALDVGCNTGDLTREIYKYIVNLFNCQTCKMLGIDIDPTLIERAIEKNENKCLTFSCCNFMDKNKRDLLLAKHFENNGISKFDVVFCFSTTMWIHLNYGDDGLRDFLQTLCQLSKILIIEPQPWKCYRNAVKRIKQTNSEFPLFKGLKLRCDVDTDIEKYLIDKCKFQLIYKSPMTQWGRQVLILINNT